MAAQETQAVPVDPAQQVLQETLVGQVTPERQVVPALTASPELRDTTQPTARALAALMALQLSTSNRSSSLATELSLVAATVRGPRWRAWLWQPR